MNETTPEVAWKAMQKAADYGVPIQDESTEGDDDDAAVPADLLELHEVLEWERAVSDAGS